MCQEAIVSNFENFINEKISVSERNDKMGPIPSLSLPAVITCRKNAPCIKGCYARRVQRHKSVINAYTRNYNIYLNNPDLFFNQLDAYLKLNRYFRLHVAGDFPSADYFRRCVEVVKNNSHCKVLAFTKQFEMVNDFIKSGGAVPDNFIIIFSGWNGWKCKNPYNLPESEVIFPDTEINDNWKICGGNCFECACRGVGCWELQPGETIAFYKH